MNAVRLALGTLTVFPVQPPSVVDKRVAGRAMMLAPLVAIVLFAPLWLLTLLVEDRWSPFLVAVLWVGGLALLTRAMHLDGLADTADGLGSGKPADQALEIMRKSDVGPFGVATLVLVLLLQVAAASQLLTLRDGASLLAVAVVWSRLVLPGACLSPAARSDGLGSTVAGSVNVGHALMSTGIAIVVTTLVLVLFSEGDAQIAYSGIAGPGVGLLFCAWCVKRLGGVTGDVLGACVEVAFTASLLVMCLGPAPL